MKLEVDFAGVVVEGEVDVEDFAVLVVTWLKKLTPPTSMMMEWMRPA